MSNHKSAENYIVQREAQDLRFAINKLNESNINVWIVSGDRKENVMAISESLDMHKTTSLKVEFHEKDNLDELDIKMNMFFLQFVGDGQSEQMMRMKTRGVVAINVEAGNNAKKSKNKELSIFVHRVCFNRNM
jgi:soluble P-type ATPase